ncbi:putative holin-like toxin [Enterococcus hirae]
MTCFLERISLSVFEALMFVIAFATLVLTINNHKNDKKKPQFTLRQFNVYFL